MPSETEALLSLVGLLLGGTIATWTFERGVATAVSLIRIVGTLDVSDFPVGAFLVMVVFFVAYAAATRSLDRLLVGGVRWLLAG